MSIAKFPPNDAVMAFGRLYGYRGAYNDILYKYLCDRFNKPHSSLPDLMALWDGVLTPLSSPTVWGNNVLWLDASDASTIATADAAGRVSTWSDKSPEGNDAVQTTAGNQPVTGTDTIGGLNCLTFTAASSHFLNLGQPASLDFLPVTDVFTIVIVAQLDNSVTGALISKAGATSALRQYAIYEGNTGMYRSVIGGAFNSTNQDYSAAPHVFGTRIALDSNETYVDGTSLVSNGILSAASNANDVLIGARRNTDVNTGETWLLTAKLCEIQVYSRTIQNGEMLSLANALKIKWSIS